MHCSSAHFALVQVPPPEHVPPGEQSELRLHGPAQSLLVVQDIPRFEDNPWMQRFPPAWADEVPLNVSVVPLQQALRNELP